MNISHFVFLRLSTGSLLNVLRTATRESEQPGCEVIDILFALPLRTRSRCTDTAVFVVLLDSTFNASL